MFFLILFLHLKHKSIKKALKREIVMFDDSGIKGSLLNLTYEYLLTVKPTSVESEPAFSSTTNFCSKLRTRLLHAGA